MANQREDWGHVTTCRAVIGHLEVDGGVGHVPAAGRGARSRGEQGVGGRVHLARAGQPQLGNTVSDVCFMMLRVLSVKLLREDM